MIVYLSINIDVIEEVFMEENFDPNKKLQTVAIKELAGFTFIIPDYQRGYRWTPIEVENLLDDIIEFKDKTDGTDYYCIQPLVLLKKGAEYEVIDGQQRLTTLYLILLYINKTVYKNDSTFYSIIYDSAGRASSESFLKNPVKEKAQDDIDFSHIYKAYQRITEWFENKEPNDLLSSILNTILQQLRFIWYKVDDSDGTPIDIFHRLNAGKIKLTDSELIKALLLSEDSIKKTLKLSPDMSIEDEELKLEVEKANKKTLLLKQISMASEWDQIEHKLHDTEFWSFLSNIDKTTRIDLLFELSTPENKKPFDYFNTISKTKDFLEIWKEIVINFETLQEWYIDKNLYHLIGYIINENILSLKEILDYYKSSKCKDRKGFRDFLTEKIADTIKSINIDEIHYNGESGNRSLYRILNLFNVMTVDKSGGNQRYPFSKHKGTVWSIEHIHAQNSQELQKRKDWFNWLDYQSKALSKVEFPNEPDKEQRRVENLCRIQLELPKFKTDGKGLEKIFREIAYDVESLLNDSKDDDSMHLISNLALLGKNDNSAFNSSTFAAKRLKMMELDKSGSYIPICTRNVFCKYYNPDAENFSFWTTEDRKTYRKSIIDTLTEAGFPPKYNDGSNIENEED